MIINKRSNSITCHSLHGAHIEGLGKKSKKGLPWFKKGPTEGRRASYTSPPSNEPKGLGSRNGTSKSMTSLHSLEKEFTFNHLMTNKVLTVLEQVDDSLEIPPSSDVERVHRDNYYRVCQIGEGASSTVNMVVDPKRKRFALKALDPTKCPSSDDFLAAALDLAMEVKLLSQLNHENVIKLQGVCSGHFSTSFTEEDSEGYFLILDLLDTVLSDTLARLRKENKKQQQQQQKSKSTFARRRKQVEAKVDTSMMYERMQTIALGVVKGMMYLQENGIVIRDLKPANIGFDEYGKVILFDFGMARKLEECDPDEMCGSPRYMAPEVMGGKGYSYKADVYSFGIILYELCSLQHAYDDLGKYGNDMEEFNRLVIGNMRPKLDMIACPRTKKLIEDCWNANPTQRPSFDEIYKEIIEITSCNGSMTQ